MRRLPEYASPLVYTEFDPIHARWLDDPASTVHSGLIDPTLISNLLRQNDWLNSEMKKGDKMKDVRPEFWDDKPSGPSSVEVTQLRNIC